MASEKREAFLHGELIGHIEGLSADNLNWYGRWTPLSSEKQQLLLQAFEAADQEGPDVYLVVEGFEDTTFLITAIDEGQIDMRIEE